MSQNLYIPGLNGIRFCAAFFVIVSHIEHFRDMHNLSHIHEFIGSFADLGVEIFFTLSGFLITFLLFKEYETTKTVSIRNFYMRRILRIWPLYFLVLVIGLFILPTFFTQNSVNNSAPILILYVFFLPHLAKVLYVLNYSLAVLWSIGVEENFYILFPWFFRKKRRHIFRALIIAIIGFLCIKFVVSYAAFQDIPLKEYVVLLFKFLLHLKFECMLVGAIGAYLVFSKNDFIRYFHKTYVFSGALFLLLFLQFIHVHQIINLLHLDPIFATVFTPFIHSVFTLIIIVYATQENRVKDFLEHPTLYFLGKISYGLYVFHPILLILLYTLPFYSLSHNWFLQYVIIIGGTIVISSLSYTYYEKWFLKRKTSFSTILSGDSARKQKL
ncbi:MAG: acyltransferase [Bacteroidales bacterium]